MDDDIAGKAMDLERLGHGCQDALVASCGGLDQMDHTTTLSDKWDAVYISTMRLTEMVDAIKCGTVRPQDLTPLMARVRDAYDDGFKFLEDLSRPRVQVANAGKKQRGRKRGK